MSNNNSWISPPGSFLREEIEEREWSQRDLAYILGVPEQSVNAILNGKRGISPDMAKAFGKAFDVPAEFFLNLQRAYDLSNAEEPSPDIEKRAKLQNIYPVREMIKRGWLVDSEADLIEAQMFSFFNVKSSNEIPHMSHAAKKTDYEEDIPPTQLAWFFRVKQIAEEMIVKTYSKTKVLNAIEELKQLRNEPENIRHVPVILNNAGIRFVIVEKLPKAKIDGACFWLSKKSPVIGMSLRYDRIDNFWFVLRHELEHVLNEDGQTIPVIDAELEGEKAGTEASLPKEERLANEAAGDFCAPKNEMDSFYLRKYPYFSERDVNAFATRIGVHTGLVVGQIQNRTGKYGFLRKYLKQIKKYILPSAVVDGWGEIAPVDL